MNTTFKNSGILFIATLAIMTLAACGGGKDKKAQLDKLKTEYAALGQQIKTLEAELALTDTTKAKSKDVYTQVIQPQPFAHYIDVQGMVDARENVEITPKSAGIVKRILVREGQAVSAGQVLAELESDIVQTQIAGLRTQLDFATDIFNRQKKLWDQKIGSEVQYLQAKNNKDALERQIATAEENLDLTRIRSLINGTVDAVNIKVGQGAAPAASAFRVVNYNDLKVKANISEVYASKVNSGNMVKVNFPDLNKEISGKIQFASKVIDPLKRTFTAEVGLDGDKSAYRPNMIAVLKIVDYTNEAAIVLPINSIQTKGSESYVYTTAQKGNDVVAVHTPVTLGTSYDGKVEITSGLKAGDTVVTSGQFDLVDGMVIIVKKQ